MSRDNKSNPPRGRDQAIKKKNYDNSAAAEVWCAADHTERRIKSLVPVVSDISPCGDHLQHHLAVPLPVLDLQLDEHTAARRWRRFWREEETQLDKVVQNINKSLFFF